jgi:hypothetical protein
VIAIIVILVSLLMVGIFYAYGRMKQAGAVSEIKQLDASLQAFKGKYNVYPPSRIRLCSNYATYISSPTPAANGGPALDQASITFINRMWPNIGQWSNVDWAGIGAPVDEILEGDQCLVFFLGGIPSNPNTPGGYSFNGFSNNGKDPASLNVNAGRTPPFFAFTADRMMTVAGRTTNFPSFNDNYSQRQPVPYLYFSANNQANGYTLTPCGAPPYFISLPDNTGGVVNVYPYQSGGKYQNPNTCQIICAGADGMYGTSGAGTWTPQTAETVYPINNPGNDDLTNFYDVRMGVSR